MCSYWIGSITRYEWEDTRVPWGTVRIGIEIGA